MKKLNFDEMKVSTSVGTKDGIAAGSAVSGDCYTCDSHDGDNDGMCDCDEGGSDEK